MGNGGERFGVDDERCERRAGGGGGALRGGVSPPSCKGEWEGEGDGDEAADGDGGDLSFNSEWFELGDRSFEARCHGRKRRRRNCCREEASSGGTTGC